MGDRTLGNGASPPYPVDFVSGAPLAFHRNGSKLEGLQMNMFSIIFFVQLPLTNVWFNNSVPKSCNSIIWAMELHLICISDSLQTQSSDVVIWSNITWYCTHHCRSWGRKTPHTLPWWASYGVSFEEYFDKIDHVVMTLYSSKLTWITEENGCIYFKWQV